MVTENLKTELARRRKMLRDIYRYFHRSFVMNVFHKSNLIYTPIRPNAGLYANFHHFDVYSICSCGCSSCCIRIVDSDMKSQAVEVNAILAHIETVEKVSQCNRYTVSP